ncbi:MAG: TPM domain-containing protein [Burkholderiaceae bacterium]|nr:TPM domain-containing protein [Burkholderiaceae bacterium]
MKPAGRAVAAAVAAAVIALLALAPQWAARAQGLAAVPALSARVTDLTGTLDATQRAELEQRLAGIEARKGAQVAILMVGSTAPETIEQYAIRVAEAWRLGRDRVDGKAIDDGVLVLVAKDDRKVRIEVGYGLEGAIPDALAKRVIAETIVPRFREGRFYDGLGSALTDLSRLIDGEALPPAVQDRGGEAGSDGWVPTLMLVLVIGMVATAVLGKLFGASAGGAGAALAAILQGAPLLLAFVLGALAFILFLIFASTGGGFRPGSRGRGARSVWTSGGGGFGGGGGGGGGFSGGGGGFGGGGASGSW